MQNTRIQSLVQELRSHMPLGNEACAPQQKIPHTTTKTQRNQINKIKKKYWISSLKSITGELYTKVQPSQEFFRIEHTDLHWLFSQHQPHAVM